MSLAGVVRRAVPWVILIAAMAILLAPAVYAFLLPLVQNDSPATAVYADMVSSARTYAILRNSLVAAVGASLVASIVGAVLALSTVYTGSRWTAAIVAIAVAPLFIPPYVFATAWVDLLGTNGLIARIMDTAAGQRWATPNPYNIIGAIWVMGCAFVPIPFLCAMFGIHTADGRAAAPLRLAGDESRVITSVLLPALAPYIVCGFLFATVFALLEIGAPALLQINVYPVEIYTEFNLTYDGAAAAARAIPLIAAAGLFVAMLMAVLSRISIGDGLGAHSWKPIAASTRSRAAAMVFSILSLGVCIALPLAVVVARSFPVSTYAEVFITSRQAIVASIAVAIATVVVVMVVSLIAYAVTDRRTYSFMAALGIVSFLVSGPVIGIGMVFLWNRPGLPGMVYDSSAIVVIACAARFIGLALIATRIALDAIPRSYTDASAVFHLSKWDRLTNVRIPAASPGLLAVSVIVFAWAFGELGATVLVCPPGFTVLAVRLHTLLHYGPSNVTAALSVVSAAVPIAIALAVYALIRSRGGRKFA